MSDKNVNGKDPRLSKLNFHVGRTVHFAHGYRKVGGREVRGKLNSFGYKSVGRCKSNRVALFEAERKHKSPSNA